MFEHDLMNEIVSAGLLTNSAVKQVCRAHMAAYQGRLEQVIENIFVTTVKN